MDVTVSALGAIVALIVAIILIIKKVHPVYGLIVGALIGGIVGGAGITGTVDLMISGAKGMMSAILRILTSGVLAGVLIKSGAADKIAESIVEKIGENNALASLTIATMVLTMVGVFIDVSVITVAPIALAIANKAKLTKTGILIAMIGGGKAGNIMSPNPNTIALAENFGVSLTNVMVAGIVSAIFGVIVTFIISNKLKYKGTVITAKDLVNDLKEKPSFVTAIVGPLVAIILLALRPIAGIVIDPLIALPVGGIIGAIAMGKGRKINEYAIFGIGKMSGVAVLLIGTGTVAGIIANSELKDLIIQGINTFGLPAFALAPVSGLLMAAATASTTSGAAVASSVFGPTILELGVSGVAAAAMINASCTVLDSLPHGSFFHTTGGSINMEMKERLKLIPYEATVGLTMTIVSVIVFGIIL